MWVKGSGQRSRVDGAPSTSPALRLDEVLPLLDRDEMSDEEMVAYLARCQLDPADAARLDRDACCTRSSRRRTSTTRTRTGSTCWPGPRTASGSCNECFGDEAVWIPYIRPGFTLSKQVAEAIQPEVKLVVLAKHGLIRLGQHRRGGVPEDDRGDQPGGQFVNERTGDISRFGGRKLEPQGSLSELLPAIRGAVSWSVRRC